MVTSCKILVSQCRFPLPPFRKDWLTRSPITPSPSAAGKRQRRPVIRSYFANNGSAGIMVRGEVTVPRNARSVDLTQVSEWDDGQLHRKDDYLASEEPLEIRIGADPLSVTMRTPGHDRELAAGFLFTEGLIQRASDIESLESIASEDASSNRSNVIVATLKPESAPDLDRLRRHFFASSSCGICGKASIDAVRNRTLAAPNPNFRLSTDTLTRLPEALRESQDVFDRTGGLHGVALFDVQGHLLIAREDI